MLFVFLSKAVCADEQLISKVISMQGCAPTTAARHIWVWQKEVALRRSSELNAHKGGGRRILCPQRLLPTALTGYSFRELAS